MDSIKKFTLTQKIIWGASFIFPTAGVVWGLVQIVEAREQKVKDQIIPVIVQTIKEEINPLKDSIKSINAQLSKVNQTMIKSSAKDGKKDSILFRAFYDYRIENAQSDKEVIKILKEINEKTSLFNTFSDVSKKNWTPLSTIQ